MNPLGFVDGAHYTQHVGDVKAMKRAGNDDEAAALLVRLIEAVERQAAGGGPTAGFLAPWYYAQLATIYRKLKRFDSEAAVLRRYIQGNAKFGEAPDAEFLRRLEVAQSRVVEAERLRLGLPPVL